MKFLIVKTSALGDIVQTMLVLDYLKMIRPDCQIDWVAEKAGTHLLKAQDKIHQVITIDTKSWRICKQWSEFNKFIKTLRSNPYDAVFDLQGNVKSGLILALCKAKNKVGFGKKTVHEYPNTWFTNIKYDFPPNNNIQKDNLFLVQSYFNDFRFPNKKPLSKSSNSSLEMMICPGSMWENKQLSKDSLQGFLDKIMMQLPHTRFNFIWGNAVEKELVNELHTKYSQSQILEKMELPELQKRMERMKLVIAMDSLPLHLAGTTSALTYSVFGASSAAKFNPPGESHHALQGHCPYGKTFVKRCPLLRTCPTGACIKNITSEQLWADFWPWFNKYM